MIVERGIIPDPDNTSLEGVFASAKTSGHSPFERFMIHFRDDSTQDVQGGYFTPDQPLLLGELSTVSSFKKKYAVDGPTARELAYANEYYARIIKYREVAGKLWEDAHLSEVYNPEFLQDQLHFSKSISNRVPVTGNRNNFRAVLTYFLIGLQADSNYKELVTHTEQFIKRTRTLQPNDQRNAWVSEASSFILDYEVNEIFDFLDDDEPTINDIVGFNQPLSSTEIEQLDRLFIDLDEPEQYGYACFLNSLSQVRQSVFELNRADKIIQTIKGYGVTENNMGKIDIVSRKLNAYITVYLEKAMNHWKTETPGVAVKNSILPIFLVNTLTRSSNDIFPENYRALLLDNFITGLSQEVIDYYADFYREILQVNQEKNSIPTESQQALYETVDAAYKSGKALQFMHRLDQNYPEKDVSDSAMHAVEKNFTIIAKYIGQSTIPFTSTLSGEPVTIELSLPPGGRFINVIVYSEQQELIALQIDKLGIILGVPYGYRGEKKKKILSEVFQTVTEKLELENIIIPEVVFTRPNVLPLEKPSTESIGSVQERFRPAPVIQEKEDDKVSLVTHEEAPALVFGDCSAIFSLLSKNGQRLMREKMSQVAITGLEAEVKRIRKLGRENGFPRFRLRAGNERAVFILNEVNEWVPDTAGNRAKVYKKK